MSNSLGKAILCGITIAVFFISEMCIAPRAAADNTNPLPPGTPMLPSAGLAAFSIDGQQKELGHLQIVAASDAKFAQALRIKSDPGALEEYSVSVIAPVVGPIRIGDVLLAHFWVRCADSMTGEGFTTFTLERNRPEFQKIAQFKISSRNQWKEVFVPFVATRNLPDGFARVAFWAGYDRQTIEIGGVEVTNFHNAVKRDDLPETKVTYEGRDEGAKWRKDALARIEQIRKGNLTVYVTDSKGSAVPNAQVHIVLRQHAFGFGTSVYTNYLLDNTPDAVKYRQTILSMFNLAVFENDMKWQETWDGIPPDVDRALKWLRDHNIVVRGHNLVWPGWQWLPEQLRKYQKDPVKLREITANHITSEVSHFRGQLIDWDVVNEPFTNNDLINLLGGRKIMLEWYSLAHQADPNARLFINDFGILDGGAHNPHRDFYFNTIKYLKDNGAPIGGIGIQSHFGTDLPAPESILKILDRFATLGLPIESTELSLSLHDSQLQADYLRDYLIALFSHPDVQDIILWGFWQKIHWRPEGGIFTNDWTMRPAAKVWIDLTQKQWHTDATANTDANGQASFRGFFGTYDVTTTVGGISKTVTSRLDPANTRLIIQME
jgi:endo-1,4-beta-xylanase